MPRCSAADLDTPPVRLVPTVSNETELPPPAHLSPAMATWWKQVMTDYALEPHHLRSLDMRL